MATDAFGTWFAKESFACRRTARQIDALAFAFVGCWTKVSVLTAAALMVNEVLVTEALPLVAVNCFEPVRLMLRLPNVAMPLALVDCDVVPLSVPVLPTANDMTTDAFGTRLPLE